MSKELDEKQKILDSLLESKSKIQEQQQENIKILDTHPSIDNAYLLFQQGKVSEADFLSYKDTREAIEAQVNGFPQVMQILDTEIEQIKTEIKDLEAQSPKKRQSPLTICVLSCLCVVLAACSLWFWNETQHLNTEVETLSEENSNLEARVYDISQKIARKDVESQKLQSEKAELENKVDSCSVRIVELAAQLNQIGYVVEGAKYYHRFEIDTHSWDGVYYDMNLECSEFSNADEYWAYNIEYCEYLGYSPCPTCW